MATITNGFNSSDGNIHGYAVKLPTGQVINVTYQGSQAHGDNLAAALSTPPHWPL
jgi:hypothetical protein